MQAAYNTSKREVLKHMGNTVASLFRVVKGKAIEDMQDTSRAFGLLLHTSSLKTPALTHAICQTVQKQVR